MKLNLYLLSGNRSPHHSRRLCSIGIFYFSIKPGLICRINCTKKLTIRRCEHTQTREKNVGFKLNTSCRGQDASTKSWTRCCHSEFVYKPPRLGAGNTFDIWKCYIAFSSHSVSVAATATSVLHRRRKRTLLRVGLSSNKSGFESTEIENGKLWLQQPGGASSTRAG